ncbi:hypothetical protein Btru_061051 [Bulinus truncatus]|nr:hypothetical protein Btru_061051 [Bulinus truncatus]
MDIETDGEVSYCSQPLNSQNPRFMSPVWDPKSGNLERDQSLKQFNKNTAKPTQSEKSESETKRELFKQLICLSKDSSDATIKECLEAIFDSGRAKNKFSVEEQNMDRLNPYKESFPIDDQGKCEIYFEGLIHDKELRLKTDNETAHNDAVREFKQDANVEPDVRQQITGVRQSRNNPFFKPFKLSFHVNDQLRIHPKAFVQLKKDEKDKLLEVTRQLNDKTLSRSDINVLPKDHPLKVILWKYRLHFDHEFSHRLIYIARRLDVEDLDDYKVNGIAILRNIPTFSLNKIFNFLFETCTTATQLKIATDFAECVGAKTLSEFCAAGEYVIILSKEERNKLIKSGCAISEDIEKNLTKLMNDKLEQNKNSFDGLIKMYEDFVQKKYSEAAAGKNQEYSGLTSKDAAGVNQDGWQIAKNKSQKKKDSKLEKNQEDDFMKFSSSWSAATHYVKHGEKMCKIFNVTQISIESYIQIANEMTKESKADDFWSQDGNMLFRYYKKKITKECKTKEKKIEHTCKLILSCFSPWEQFNIVTFCQKQKKVKNKFAWLYK